MFALLPASFPNLAALVQSMDKALVVTPPPIEAIGKRLRAAFGRAKSGQYGGLTQSELRKLPFAYWVSGAPPLPVEHPDLVQRYWLQELPAATRSGARRAKRWLAPLFLSYCEAFDPRDNWFLDFSEKVESAVRLSDGAFAEKLRELHQDVAFFRPHEVAAKLAARLLSHPKRFDEALADYLLWQGFVDTALGGAVLKSALESSEETLRNPAVVARVLEWVRKLGAPIDKTSYRVLFADALLRPWYKRRPPDSIKASLMGFFVEVYGDPRILRHRQYQWQGVSLEAVTVLMTWLAGDTLRGFMRILERTADQIWSYRRKFWMAYYDKGYIEEAWLALGWDAQRIARSLKVDQQGMGYGRLDGGAATDQSVLILKIGQLVFTEWSHNGSLRAYIDGAPDTPELYQATYDGTDLRDPASMDFHDGVNLNPELRHMNSVGGTWQRKARDFIRKHTGINLSDREIL